MLVSFEKLSLQNMSLLEQVARQRERARKPAGELTVQSCSEPGWLLFGVKPRAVCVPWEQTQSGVFPDSGSSTCVPWAPPDPAACTPVLFAFDYRPQMPLCECPS